MSRKSSSAVAHPDQSLLRSINVAFDADYPDRISHFRPTSKSIPVLQALLGHTAARAVLVTAPYGSGKSLVAAYALQIIENSVESSASLKKVNERLRAVSPDTAARVASRARSKKAKGLVIALQGTQDDLIGAIVDGANSSVRRSRKGHGGGRPRVVQKQPTLIATIKCVIELAQLGSFDSVLIIWDEFGRHLERLISEGRAAELGELQSLAELASRSKGVQLSLALLTHRGLSQYAAAAPQSVRTEWAKIEGRFESLTYVDDSKEMYRLVAETVRDRGAKAPSSEEKRWLADFLKRARGLGIFKELTLPEASSLLETAFPMHPLVLYALPRVAARVSQNERTIFDFLGQESFRRLVSLGRIYDYFSDSMRADTGPGGAHRQYLETETAIRRTGSEAEVEALKAACLLGLGIAGERGRVSRDMLCAALSFPGVTSSPHEAIAQLIERKLLLYRKHGDDVSVWHGADVDLRGVLEDQKERSRAGFNLIEFLKKEWPAPVWRPVQFNDDYHIKRFFSGKYVTPAQFQALCDQPNAAAKAFDGADGGILFVLAESAGDQDRVRSTAISGGLGQGIIVGVPARQVSLTETALEVACLEQMLRDPELVAKDPLVELELKHFLDDARGYLHRGIDQLIAPQAGGPTFWHEAEPIQPASPAEFRVWLSGVIEGIYPATPRINNEMINRRRVSAPVANARKKLEMAVLERAGKQGLGIEGNFPDASIFRTVLLNTGLYRNDVTGGWGFADPSELEDVGLRLVWLEFKRFFTEVNADRPKAFSALFDRLKAPPIGLRFGVVPVLLAAAFRAFPSAISLRRNGEYVDDILPSIIEDICKHADDFSIQVIDLSLRQRDTANAVQKVFADCDPGITSQSDLVRAGYDSLRTWLAALPPIAINTLRISPKAIEFRNTAISQRDPVQLLFHDMPSMLAASDLSGLIEELTGLRNEIQSVVAEVRREAEALTRRVLDVGLDRREGTLAEACQRWSKCFSGADLQRAGGGGAVAFVNRLSQSYDSDELLLDSIASQLVGQPVARWDDNSIGRFDRALSEAVRGVEEESVRLALAGPANPVIVSNLSRLIEARIRGLYESLGSLVGEARASEAMHRAARKAKEVKQDGDNSRSA